VGIHAPGGQVQQTVVRLGLTPVGERSVPIERQTRDLLTLLPAANSSMHEQVISHLINGTAGAILHRQLIYSGVLSEEASYTERLVALVEIAA